VEFDPYSYDERQEEPDRVFDIEGMSPDHAVILAAFSIMLAAQKGGIRDIYDCQRILGARPFFITSIVTKYGEEAREILVQTLEERIGEIDDDEEPDDQGT